MAETFDYPPDPTPDSALTHGLRAFTIGLAALTLVVIGMAIGMFMGPLKAHASVVCEHRSAEHAAQHHQTREADSRFHVLHGELPTCGLDNERHDDNHDDGDLRVPHRDHRGIHCGLRGCG